MSLALVEKLGSVDEPEEKEKIEKDKKKENCSTGGTTAAVSASGAVPVAASPPSALCHRASGTERSPLAKTLLETPCLPTE